MQLPHPSVALRIVPGRGALKQQQHMAPRLRGHIAKAHRKTKMLERTAVPRMLYVKLSKSESNTFAMIMPSNRSVDIDNIYDFEIAKLMYTMRGKK